MPKIAYISKWFKQPSLDIIAKAEEICEEYSEMGFDLTLRQLYYQFVARDLLPNKQSEYNRLGRIINEARLAGLLDWDYIVDRTRKLERKPHWENPADLLKEAARQYRIDKWEGQKYRPEVWIEKQALVGVIEKVCEDNDVPYFACRGYNSQSNQWRAAGRSIEHAEKGQKPIIIHLGDHDPSGVNMTSDLRNRFELFWAEETEVIRLALNMDQIQEYDPPPNPAKMTDPRSAEYIEEYGLSSWELDALEPTVINDLIKNSIDDYRDEDKWKAMVDREEEERNKLKSLSSRWAEVNDLLNEKEE